MSRVVLSNQLLLKELHVIIALVSFKNKNQAITTTSKSLENYISRSESMHIQTIQFKLLAPIKKLNSSKNIYLHCEKLSYNV